MIAELRFTGSLPPIAVFVLAALAATAVAWFYRRETSSVGGVAGYLLPVLRATAVALVVLILAGPVWHRRQVIGTLGRVVFAVDVSESMALADSQESGSQPSRLQRAVALLFGDEARPGWLDALASTHAVDIVAFADGQPVLVRSTRGGEDAGEGWWEPEAAGDRTDLTSPLRPALTRASAGAGESGGDEQASEARRSAVVLMTDGRDNVGASPVELAARLGAAAVPVHTLGIGSEDEPPDVGIVDVTRPDSVADDARLAGEITLKRFGMAGQAIPVRIESGGETVWQQTVEIDSEGQQSVPFELEVEPIVEQIRSAVPRGVRRRSVVMNFQALIDPLEGESTRQNNSLSFRVAATTRRRRLLMLEGSSRWEFRYLRNLFDRDPSWTVDTVLFGPGTDQPEVTRGGEPGQLPSTQAEMARYDAVVLGEIPVDQFSQSDAHRLREFVARGGGLVVIDGRYDRIRHLAAGLLSDLIPVRYEEQDARMRIERLRPRRVGLDHPMMNLAGDPQALDELWSQLPPPVTAVRVQPHSDAAVWADAVGGGGRETPWLVTRLYGSGRVFYLSADQTWRWRYKVADRFHARFWNQLLGAVMQPPYAASDQFLAIGTDRVEYAPGDAATIRVRLQDTQGRPAGDATVDALLVSGDQVVASVPLAVDDPQRGTYLGITSPLDPGEYQIRVRASGFDNAALQASTPIWVGSSNALEHQRVSLDRSALVQIAEASGGHYVHESSAEELLAQLKPLSSGTVVESDILIWQSFYWFAAVMALLTLEWVLRKRAGLV